MSWGRWGGGAQSDVERYRAGYPGKTDRTDLVRNWQFYSGEIGMNHNNKEKIENVLAWNDREPEDKYYILEARHDYIQWLFPIRENSAFNYDAQELQPHEAQRMMQQEAQERPGAGRISRAYQMMLGFYGARLVDPVNGTIGRAENFEARFKFLNRSSHNYLRITRILKCLGELGYEHYKKHFMNFFIDEVFGENHYMPNTRDSLENYWVEVIKSDEERAQLKQKMKDLAAQFPYQPKRETWSYSGGGGWKGKAQTQGAKTNNNNGANKKGKVEGASASSAAALAADDPTTMDPMTIDQVEEKDSKVAGPEEAPKDQKSLQQAATHEPEYTATNVQSPTTDPANQSNFPPAPQVSQGDVSMDDATATEEVAADSAKEGAAAQETCDANETKQNDEADDTKRDVHTL